MVLVIKKAERKKQKLKLCLFGPSGSGKTWSGLMTAVAMGAKKILVIDTERSAALYADAYSFDVIELDDSHSPEQFVDAMQLGVRSGYDFIITDSLSHSWAGTDGALELAQKLGGAYTDWGKVSPRINRLFAEILKLDAHLIATMRSKSDTILVPYTAKDGSTKHRPETHGIKPISKKESEYEFTTVLRLDQEHNFMAVKDRTRLFDHKEPIAYNENVGKRLIEWLNSGAEPAPEVEPVEPTITEKDVITALVARINFASTVAEAMGLKADWITIQQDYPKLKKVTIDHVEKLFKEKEGY